jgi:hypothetical protein
MMQGIKPNPLTAKIAKFLRKESRVNASTLRTLRLNEVNQQPATILLTKL